MHIHMVRVKNCIDAVALLIVALVALCKADRILFEHDNCEACKMDTASVLHGLGYPAENHVIKTVDGYLLEIFRIPHGKHNTNRKGRIPVMAQHGGNGMSDNFVLTFDDVPDTYVTRLADLGYDVWITNVRGSRYARHEQFFPTQFNYWNFTLDDWSLTDAKAIIDFVLEETKYPSLTYIGHSLGGMMLTMLLSAFPEYNDKIHYAQLLSPVIYLARNPVLSANSIMGPPVLRMQEFLADNGIISTLGHVTANQAKLMAEICSRRPINRLCLLGVGLGIGINPHSFPNMNAEKFEILIDEGTQALAFKVAVHLMQITVRDAVQKYDYRNKNVEVYQTKSPPLYLLSNIRTSIQVYYPKNDRFIVYEDAEKFFKKLKNANLTTHLMKPEKFNHFDYFYGKSRFSFLDKAVKDIKEFHENHHIKPLSFSLHAT